MYVVFVAFVGGGGDLRGVGVVGPGEDVGSAAIVGAEVEVEGFDDSTRTFMGSASAADEDVGTGGIETSGA